MESSLDLSVDRLSEVPLATQLAWKLRTFVATGALAPGARLPGVREVAEVAGVNVNTVRSVYGRLEEEGLISSQHGRGTFVAAGAAPSEPLAQIAAVAAQEARRQGVDLRDVAAALFVEPTPHATVRGKRPGGESSAGDARAQRRQLRREIGELEGELAYLRRAQPGPGESEDPGPSTHRRTGDRGARMPRVEELAATRDELRDRVQALRDERAQARATIRRQQAAAAADETTGPARSPDARVWRHGGVWTGAGRPRGVVYES